MQPITCPNKILLTLAAIINLISSALCVRCFCTEDHCAYGVCTSDWCLVGIKQAGAVIRTCGNDAAKLLKVCRKDVSDWSEVCACNTPFCNTFAFLRQQIAYNRFGPQPPDLPAPAQHDTSDDVGPFFNQPPPPTAEYVPSIRDPDYRTFQRVDTPYGGGTRTNSNGDQSLDEEARRKVNQQSSYLIIVLILVPLSVGSCAVLLVSVNYYCNLC